MESEGASASEERRSATEAARCPNAQLLCVQAGKEQRDLGENSPSCDLPHWFEEQRV